MSRRAVERFGFMIAMVAFVSCGDLLGIDEIEFQSPDPVETPGAGGASAGSSPRPAAGSGGQSGAPSPGGEAGQAGDGGDEPSGVQCSTHLDCNPEVVPHDPASISDDPYLCVDARCVRMRNDDTTNPSQGDGGCREVLGREQLASGAEPFVFGAFSRIYYGQPQPSVATRNYDLVVREFTSKGGVTIGGKTRIPMAIVCEGVSVNHEYLARTFDHLVNELRVPAVITTFEPDDLKWIFEHVHEDFERSVLFVSAYQSDSSLTALEDRGLLWHMLGGPAELAPPYVPLVERAEAYVKSTRGISGPIRLALVESQSSFHSDIGTILHEQLRFNGKSPSQNGDEYYLRLRIPGEDKFDELVEDYLPKLQEFVPDVVVFTGANEATHLMTMMEIAELPPDVPRAAPFYVLSPSQYASRYELGDIVLALDLYDRVAGINYAAAEDDTLYQSYLSAFEATFPADGYLGGIENFYDAAYYLIYSAVAAGNERPLDGAALAQGFRRLLEGPTYYVGGLHIPATSVALRTEPSISLHGTMGPPSFDPGTGAWRGNGSVFCVDEREGASEFLMDVMTYDRITGELVGDFPCIEGF